jgi:GTP cyclohydrolase I
MSLMDAIDPQGVGVVVEAEHLCKTSSTHEEPI